MDKVPKVKLNTLITDLEIFLVQRQSLVEKFLVKLKIFLVELKIFIDELKIFLEA